MEVKLQSGEQIVDLERNGYKIIQNRERFCFGMDAVLLTGFAKVGKGERALDLGTGTGIIPILLEAKTEGQDFEALEIQPENPDEPKAIARHEIKCNLEDVIRESAKLLKPKGRFYMVHRPRRLAEIISLMKEYRIEPKRLRMIHPFADRDANMLLIEGVRGGKSMMVVEPPLIVYDEPGVYTKEIHRIYGF